MSEVALLAVSCARCGHIIAFAMIRPDAFVRRQGWRRTADGGWACPDCSRLDNPTPAPEAAR